VKNFVVQIWVRPKKPCHSIVICGPRILAGMLNIDARDNCYHLSYILGHMAYFYTNYIFLQIFGLAESNVIPTGITACTSNGVGTAPARIVGGSEIIEHSWWWLAKAEFKIVARSKPSHKS